MSQWRGRASRQADEASRLRVWVAIGSLLVVGVGLYGARGSLGLFIVPWQEAFQVDRGVASGASALTFVAFGLGQPVAGRLLERFSGRSVLIAGLGLCVAGWGGAAISPSFALTLLFAGGLAGFGIGLGSMVTLAFVGSELVGSRHGLLFGALSAATAGGQALVVPLVTLTIGDGPGVALLTLSAIAGLLMVIVSLTLRGTHAPNHREGSAAYGSKLDWLRTPAAWYLLVAFFICGYTTTGVPETHLVPMALDHHVELSVASAALSVLAIFNAIGVLAAGALTDRVDRALLLAGIYGLRGLTLLALPLVSDGAGLIAFAVAFGLADYATVPPTAALVRSRFGPNWPLVFGVISAGHQIGSALGAYLGGWSYEVTGSYVFIFISAGLTLAVASWFSLLLRVRVVKTQVAGA